MILLKYNQLFGLGIEVYIINLIIAIPVFFLLRWILRKIIKNGKIQKVTTWIGTLISTPIIYIGLIILWITIMSYYPSVEFDKAKWDTDKEKRYEMSEDIIQSNMLIGLTKQEVIELLGIEENKIESNLWYYYLGFVPRFLSIDPDVLTIKFVNGKVTEVGQHET